ncbi:Scr1 family TA system antitoxin-like transcriptional regulator [Streptomyces sp. NPDC127068]|uniref:helix-turn-helix domain-containing protein n=1 Tax=Streptomyces sp. NPDC127068 TaxID=3347127 RepID=UPI00365913BC
MNRKELDPDRSPEAAFGARLRRAREGRGWTQDQLGKLMECSGRHISGVETASKPPTRRLAMNADAALGTGNLFEREWTKIRHGSLLEGFPEYVVCEGRAAEVRLYEVGIVPGLLQTPDYAAALADSAVRRGKISQDQASERVAMVAQRQAALRRTPPPTVLAVLDEGCIRRPIGEPAVMKAQLDWLAAFAEQPNTVLQVAHFGMGELRPFDLPLYILTMPDRSLMSYAESAFRGQLERNSAAVAPVLGDYHQLQAHALSQAASVDLIDQLRKGAP